MINYNIMMKKSLQENFTFFLNITENWAGVQRIYKNLIKYLKNYRNIIDR